MKSFLAAAEDVFWPVIIVGASVFLIRVWVVMWSQPRRIRSMLLKQGISGPKPSFFYGNIQQIKHIQSNINKFYIQSSDDALSVSHNSWTYSTFPYLQQWAQQYGPIYLFSTMNKQHLYVSHPELMKAMNLHKSLDLGKPTYLSKTMEPIIGNGIIRANGPYWAYQRKLVAPEFFLHKAKNMMGLMQESTVAMIRRWRRQIESNGGVVDISVDKDLKNVAADIISKACFGSSYSQGKQIFVKLRALQDAISQPNLLFGLTNFRILPTKSNRQIWRLQKDVETLILDIVDVRRQEIGRSDKYEKDLLQVILEIAENSEDLQHISSKDRFIIDNCKNIYFAGHETTALTVSWCLLLLALHPEWQERVRAEIVEICGDELNDCLLHLDTLRHLKTLNMVIQETLRLYGPAVIAAREAFADLKLGDMTIPKGTNIWILIAALHRDPENWGPDANEFKPDRFSQGIIEACKFPQLYIPFGFGSRLCLGQTFAMLEIQLLVSLMISSFSFSVSPKYCHSPVFKMLLVPEHGIRLLVRKS